MLRSPLFRFSLLGAGLVAGLILALMLRSYGYEDTKLLLGALWSPTADPVLNVLIDLVIVAVVGFAAAGLSIILFFFGVIAGTVTLILLFIGIVLQVATVSPVGALLAIVAAILIGRWWFKRHSHEFARLFQPVLDAVTWLFETAVLFVSTKSTPIAFAGPEVSMTRKEHEPLAPISPGDKNADEDPIEHLRRRLEQQMLRLGDEISGLPEIPSSPDAYGTWIDEVVRRIYIRAKNRTTEHIRAHVRLVKECLREWLEYIRIAQEIGRLGDENDVKRLKIQKQKLELKIEIGKLERVEREITGTSKEGYPAEDSAAERERFEEKVRHRLRQSMDLRKLAQEMQQEIDSIGDEQTREDHQSILDDELERERRRLLEGD